MSDQKEEVVNLEKGQSFEGKKLSGKFLTHVGPEDLDSDGRFVCTEPVILIGARAFDKVRDKLTYVKVDGVISIENEAFANCTKLEKADIGFGLDYAYLEDYDPHMFWKDKVIDSEDAYYFYLDRFAKKYGQYDVHIKEGAFKNCTNLKSFRFPSRMVLHDSPFENCSNLTELTFDGSMRLQIKPELTGRLDDWELPFRAITFKGCNNIQKMNFGKGATINIDEIASFENLKEINLTGSFYERRKFWHDALERYPEFLLILPSNLYQDRSFLVKCLRPLSNTLEAVYGYPACKHIYKNLVTKKIKIEKEKTKLRQKEMKIQRQQIDNKFSKTR